MTLGQVAKILHYKDTCSVRRLTNQKPEAGGLGYVEIGLGRRKTRLVKRDVLVDYVESCTFKECYVPKLSSKQKHAQSTVVKIGARNLLERFRNKCGD